jgi:succinoglycan biosynthesis transport protein ExoP
MNALRPIPVSLDRPAPHEGLEEPLAGSRDTIDLRWLLAVLRRRLWLFLAVAAVVFLAVATYVFVATKEYTATAQVIVDTRQLQVLPTDQEMVTANQDDSSVVDTQVAAATSRKVAERVVAALKLDNDPDFNATLNPPSLLDKLKAQVKALLGKADAGDDPASIHAGVVSTVLDGVEARRLETADVIEIDFTTEDSAKAALIANQFAQSYLDDQLQAEIDATGRASSFLSSRLSALQTQAQADADAVARYRVAHNLLSTSNTTLPEQEISNLDQQVATAGSDAAADQASLRTARAQLAHGSNGEDVGQAIDSTVVGELRNQRALVSGQLAQLTAKYGPRFPDVLKAQNQLKDIDAQIQAEINRIISNLEAKAKVSQQRLESMRASLAASKGDLAQNNVAMVGLSKLQQAATASEAVYDSYLSRFKETGAQQGIEQSRSRVISNAQPPLEPSSPKALLFLALGVVLAIAAGGGAVIVREAMDPALVTADDVERRLHIAYIGSVPLLKSLERRTKQTPSEVVVKRPESAFAEAIRSLRVSVAHLAAAGKPIVVTVTSALPGDGKTMTAACLGRSAALAGTRTVVVDCDLRRAGIGRMLGHQREADLLSVLQGAPLDDALIWDTPSGVAWLPVAADRARSPDALTGAAMDALLADLRRRFDLIILDTAPVLPVADGRILAAKSDVTLLLARWRRTPDHALRAALRALAGAGADVNGIVLTKMDIRKQTRFGFGDSTYYYNDYKSYFAA